MKESLLKYIATIVFIIGFSTTAFAQGDIDPHPADDDPIPGAPFDMKLLIVIMIIGITFAMYTIKKRRTQSITK